MWKCGLCEVAERTRPPAEAPREPQRSGEHPGADAAAQQDEVPEGSSGVPSDAPRQMTEHQQAVEQWLNRIPDDPGGLLREKLRRRYAEGRYQMGRTR